MTIRLIATGGSIAEQLDPRGVLHRSGENLLASVRLPRDFSQAIDVVDLLALSSTDIGPEEMYAIGAAVEAACQDKYIQGVVVTHGTATMEETAFWVETVVNSEKPVVFTGALRYPQDDGYDGTRNLSDALVVAAGTSSRDLGTVVVMDGVIHSAREVTEADPASLAGFQSSRFGPLGTVSFGQVDLRRKEARYRHSPPPRLPLARVDLLRCYAGMPSELVDAVVAAGARGIVIEAMTSGGIPSRVVSAVSEAISRGVIVVITSRCAHGRASRWTEEYAGIPGYGFELQKLGVAISDLSGLKARCRLLALLSAGLPAAETRQEMDTAR